MKKIRYHKRLTITKKKIVFIIIILVFLVTSIHLYYFAFHLSKVLMQAAERELKEITQQTISNNILRDSLGKVAVDDVIIANKNKAEEITDIDFKLDVAYDMMFALKGRMDAALLDIKAGKIKTNTTAIKDNLVIQVPFYTYTNNLVLMNLGPKIYIKINMIEIVKGSVTTKVTSYGINTVLIDVYLNLFITESILFPTSNKETTLEYNLLLASKVVQGKVPSLYTGKYETNSGLINLE